jgi:hypothetical protein
MRSLHNWYGWIKYVICFVLIPSVFLMLSLYFLFCLFGLIEFFLDSIVSPLLVNKLCLSVLLHFLVATLDLYTYLGNGCLLPDKIYPSLLV